jgi:NAD(P)-dependent dehydrogenase (short-subunit alcohol dehydrogenase family)
MVAERLLVAGHHLAVHDVTLPADLDTSRAEHGIPAGVPEPVPLSGDRSDAEEMVHTVASAEVALGGLEALVILPVERPARIGLEADAIAWADAWSAALTTEVLSTACAAHIAARSFMARRTAGRIILVANGHDTARSGNLPTGVTAAALTGMGADLARELRPHGIGVSVVTTSPGGTGDFAVAQVADVVSALLATPVLAGVSSRIG